MVDPGASLADSREFWSAAGILAGMAHTWVLSRISRHRGHWFALMVLCFWVGVPGTLFFWPLRYEEIAFASFVFWWWASFWASNFLWGMWLFGSGGPIIKGRGY